MKILKVVGIVLLLLVVVVAGALTYVKLGLPDVGDAPSLTVKSDSIEVARGKYLANAVAVCMDCHSTRDWSKFSGPLMPGTLGKGGERFDHAMGFPGVYFSRNITPMGISRYTDGELYRVITSGVTKEGTAMFPVMPYLNYGRMDEEDVYAIIAYLRSLDPIDNPVGASASDFPMNFILNTIPSKPQHAKRPDPSDEVAYGGYLVNAAACIECHTQVDKGQIIPELAFGGGREFNMPGGAVLRSSNITPHEAGIGSWTADQFVARFKAYADTAYVTPSVAPGEFNTIMPWTMYAQMTEQDLRAIYAYLKTVAPLDNKVTKFSPAVSVAMN